MPLLRGDFLDRPPGLAAHAAGAEQTQTTFRGRRRDGGHIYVECQGRALTVQGKVLLMGLVMDIADRHRLSIDRWFYPCSITMHRGLADLYENDARFAANIDKFGAGLTTFLVAAIRANAARHGG